MNRNDYYLMKKNIFYYYESNSKAVERDIKISKILGTEHKKLFYGKKRDVLDIRFASFVKVSPPHKNGYKINSLKLSDFMKLDFNIITDDYLFLRNKELFEKEKILKKKRDNIKSNYKATDSYTTIPYEDYFSWSNCSYCNLKPIINEFDNGRATACGCGKNEYDNISIRAESIMSYVTRNNGSALNYNINELRDNWNRWVEYDLDTYESKKKSLMNKNIRIW